MSSAIRHVSTLGAGLAYRSVEAYQEGDPPKGPVLMVANHFGGLADAMLLVSLSPRVPRIVARDVIWRIPGAGAFMSAIGAIPVHKRSDSASRGDESTNDRMFRGCYEALADGSAVLIFPEGVTQEEPNIAEIKSGAARIALGAYANGVSDLQILPVGIHYEDKAAFRSRVLVAYGRAISLESIAASLDPEGQTPDADNRAAVRSLTDRIEAGLRSVAPDFTDWAQARDLSFAAEVVLRDLAPDEGVEGVPLSLTEPLAAHLARRPEAAARVQEGVADYRRDLDEAQCSDHEVARGDSNSRLTRRRFGEAVATLVLIPYALIGLLVGLVPYLVMQVPRLIPVAPAVKATVLPLLALLAFMGEWVWTTLRAADRWGWSWAALVALLVPVFVGSTIWVGERLFLALRRFKGWATRRSRGAAVAKCRQSRIRLTNMVWEAL